MTEKQMWQNFYDQAKKHAEETIPEQVKELNREHILNKSIMEIASQKLQEIENGKKD